MVKDLSRFCFAICVLLCVTWGCEKRELWLDVVDEPTLTSLRATFEEDQALFRAQTDPPEYTFRQGLDRTIHWDRAYQSDEGYYFVPLTLSLKQESNERFQNGQQVYPYKTVLMIDPAKNDSRYTMLTFVGEGSVAAEFTGMMLLPLKRCSKHRLTNSTRS